MQGDLTSAFEALSSGGINFFDTAEVSARNLLHICSDYDFQENGLVPAARTAHHGMHIHAVQLSQLSAFGMLVECIG